MTTGVLSPQLLKEGILANTAIFETSQTSIDAAFAIASGNHDEAGLSIGPLQYNYGAANRLTELFRHMYNNHRADWDTAFAGYPTESTEFYDVNFTYTMAQKVTFGDGISELDGNGEKRLVALPWRTIFERFGAMQSYRDKYIAMADVYYLPNPTQLFNSLGCKSRISFASLADLSINRGRCFPVNLLTVDFENIDANTMLTEADKEYQKNYQINYRGNYDNAISPLPSAAMGNAIPQDVYWHGGGTDGGRRGCMANQGGTYYGTVYDPDVQFDINQEPGAAFKAELIKLGGNKTNKMMFNGVEIKKVTKGDSPIFEQPPTYAAAPQTKFRTDEGSYVGYESGSLEVAAGNKVWIDVWNWLACKTYYTTDGTTPTVDSQLYTGPITISEPIVLKALTVSVYGVAESVKTIDITVNGVSVGTGPEFGPGSYRYIRLKPDNSTGRWTSSEIKILTATGTSVGVTTSTATFTPAPNNSTTFGSWGSAMWDGNLTSNTINWGWGEAQLTLDIDLKSVVAFKTVEFYMASQYGTTGHPETPGIIQVSADGVTWYDGVMASGDATKQVYTVSA